jgi:hypothetical protein
VVTLTTSGGAGDDPPPPSRPSALALRFAPLVHLHSRERYFPIGAAEFIDWSTVSWAEGKCLDETIAIGGPRLVAGLDPDDVEATEPEKLGKSPAYAVTPSTADCRKGWRTFSADQHTRPFDRGRPPGKLPYHGFYLDLATRRHVGRPQVRHGAGQAELVGVPSYVEWRRAGDRQRITYWFLYGATMPPDDDDYVASHEGGWERVSVLLRRAQGRWKPLAMRLHARDRWRDVRWARVERVDAAGRRAPTGTHPVVYSARGSHASYATAGRRAYEVPGEDGGPVTFTDEAAACVSCPRWRTWQDVLSLRAQPWYGYGGGWGHAYEGDRTSGPLGPSPFMSDG